jgi:hypothetical protein
LRMAASNKLLVRGVWVLIVLALGLAVYFLFSDRLEHAFVVILLTWALYDLARRYGKKAKRDGT